MKHSALILPAITLALGTTGKIAAAQPAPAPLPGSDQISAPATTSTVGGDIVATPGMGGLDFNVQAPPMPMMGTITEEVAFTLDKQPIQRGPYTGVILHLHNGTNSPLMFDGDRAQVTIGGKTLVAISDAALEIESEPVPSAKQEARIAVSNAVTFGAYSAITDQKIGLGPVLPRYGNDQKRREATLERFGLRIMWPGDDTQGIVFFNTTEALNSGKVELPVVTFPSREIKGYLTALPKPGT